MNGESWPEDFPPAPSLATVAEGVSTDGVRWEVRAGGIRENCYTFLDIVLPDGRTTGGGGLGGPALPPGRLMNLSVHRSDPAMHYVVGRVHPSVARVHLEFSGGHPSGLDVRPVGESADFGVAFVAEILQATADLVNVTAWDGSGSRLDEASMAHHVRFFRHGRPDHAAGDSADDHHIGWTPPDPG